MKEKLKTVLLISLFGISIILTKQLWIELPNRVFSMARENVELNLTYDLIDMIAPSKYLIHFDENNHTLFYDESKYTLWTDARAGLESVLESEQIQIEIIDKEDFSLYNKMRSISYEFPEKLNTYILAKALEIEKPNEIIDAIDDIDSIYIYLGSEEPFFVFSNDKNNIKVSHNISYYNDLDGEDVNWDIITKVEKKFSGKKEDEVENQDIFKLSSLKEKVLNIEKNKKFNYYYSMKDMVGTDKDVYIPYEMNTVLPTVYMENQIRTMDETAKEELVEKFFGQKIDYIREVVENNGSNIYIHDKRVLKLNSNGTLEYFNALEESIGKRNLYESMNTASEFLSKTLGYSKGMYLSNIDTIEDENKNPGFVLSFRYRIRGIPIILGNANFNDFIIMEVYNNHVKSYKQIMRKDMAKSIDFGIGEKEGTILHSFDVIDSNYEMFLEDYKKTNDIRTEEDISVITVEDVLSSIKDITLAYYDSSMKEVNEELISVWVIKTDKSLYSFDVYTGQLVNKRSI